MKVVYDSAKLVKMKAIHNGFAFGFYVAAVVYDLAKIVKMKAIHNKKMSVLSEQSLAKIVKMKAIHNHLEKNTNMYTSNTL